jgi:hypothetical protein
MRIEKHTTNTVVSKEFLAVNRAASGKLPIVYKRC